MSQSLQLPELCRVGLLDLFAKAKAAEREYNAAANGMLTALGLDPRDDNKLDLDTGVITLAAKQEPQGVV